MLKNEITIGGITLQNRIVAAPLVTESGDDSGAPTEKTLDIYRGYAASGAGLVVAEQHAVHPWGRTSLRQPRLYGDAFAAGLEPMTRPFRQAGVPVVAQLNFGGRAGDKALLNEPDFELVSPSGLPTPRKSPVKVPARPLQAAEIPAIVQSFADAARRAVTLGGYNGGVQVYACHGYLVGQFLSPLTNTRGDGYGGSIKNRARLLFEIVEAVRPVIGDAPLSVRLGASDQMPGEPENGLTLAESLWVAQALAGMKIDWLSVSGNHCIYGIGVDDKDTAYFAPYSKAMREAVRPRGLPVDCTGGIRTPQTAERLLQEGVCDLVGIGRPLLADKDFLSSWPL